MLNKQYIDRLRNDEGGFSEPDVKAVEKMTGKSFADVVAEVEEQATSVTVNGQPITNKSQLKDVNAKAEYFEQLRKQGKKPKEVYDSLPE